MKNLDTDVSAPPRKKILLAEDDASVRRFLEVLLRKEGFEVIAAEDGLIAMNSALEHGDIAAFVFDAMMPNLTGYDLSRILRANPPHQQTPIIILSGLEPTENFKNDGVNYYLVKNANFAEELKKVLAELLLISND